MGAHHVGAWRDRASDREGRREKTWQLRQVGGALVPSSQVVTWLPKEKVLCTENQQLSVQILAACHGFGDNQSHQGLVEARALRSLYLVDQRWPLQSVSYYQYIYGFSERFRPLQLCR